MESLFDFLNLAAIFQFMDIPDKRSQPFQIALLLVDGFAMMSYASILEPLRAANLLSGQPLYEILQIPANGDRAYSSSGAEIPQSIADRAGLIPDMLLILAGGDPISFRDPALFQWLSSLDRHGCLMGGVSGGPVILARAGLMAGYRMTVHWEHAEALLEIQPDLMLERGLYVRDRNRLTCAGGIAPLDMMHALITELQGPDFARRVSDWFMHTEIRPAGGPQRAGIAERYDIHAPALLQTIEAMENHIADPLTLQQLTQFGGCSARQLNRLFQEKLDVSCMRFYRRLRLEKAKSLLAHQPLSLTEIALATGFASSAHFSTSFKQEFGHPPSSSRH